MAYERRRPWVRVPVGFQREWALTDSQLAAYVALSELALARYADRSGDRFVCLGSDLAGWGSDGRAVANALRRYHTLPADLVRVERHPDRRGVWVVELPGFASLQGLRSAAPGGAPAAPGDGLAIAGNTSAKGADAAETLLRRRSRPRSPSSSSSSTSTSTSGSARARPSDAEALPELMPTSLVEFLQLAAWRLTPNVRELVRERDDHWLEDEWSRFRNHHRQLGSKIRSLEALFVAWCRDPRAGERAHRRRQQATEAIAQGGLWPVCVRGRDRT